MRHRCPALFGCAVEKVAKVWAAPISQSAAVSAICGAENDLLGKSCLNPTRHTDQDERNYLRQHPISMARSSKATAELFIGTSGYSYPDWKGIVYPRWRRYSECPRRKEGRGENPFQILHRPL